MVKLSACTVRTQLSVSASSSCALCNSIHSPSRSSNLSRVTFVFASQRRPCRKVNATTIMSLYGAIAIAIVNVAYCGLKARRGHESCVKYATQLLRPVVLRTFNRGLT